MRCRRDTTRLWNTGQGKKDFLKLLFVFLCINQVCARPDFIDSMSKQFFGFMSDDNERSQQQQYQPTPDPFAEMFGSASHQVSQRPPNQHYQNHHLRQGNHPHRQGNPPHRQGYYAPPHAVQQQVHLPYSGPPPVYGQQQGFGQRQPNTNETKTDGYPPDNVKPQHPYPSQHHHQAARQYPPVEYHHQHQQQAAVVEYHKPPETVVNYQTQYHPQPPQQVEYHHIPPQAAVVEEHHGPLLEIHTGNDHAHHEPPTHVEYHHPPVEEYHHYTTHKPKGFHISFNQPSPDYKIVDRHLKLPPVKFRFHINPKIVITSNTKDPLDKKHHDDEHDLEPFPPPDVFSDHDAPPSINKHVVDHYPVEHHYPAEHHYPVEHHAVKQHYAVEHPQAKHAYPVEHHAVAHHPGQEYVYDLSHGHSHVNPHRSLGHYEPTFKIKTKPIIFTEPPPTRPTTTTRATTTTARTTTARTTTVRTTTTSRPTRRARISARNPGFSVAFTEGSTTSSTTEPSTTSTTTRRSIFRSNSERERENVGISARRDELSTSAEIPQTTVTRSSTTASTSTTTAPRSTTTTTTTTTMPTSTSSTPPSTTTTTTARPTTSTTTSTTSLPTTTSTTTTTTTTTARPTTTITTTATPRPTTTTTPRPTTTSTTTTTPRPTTTSTTTTPRPTTTSTATTTPQPVSRSTRITPAEETTLRTTTLSVDANEIDMRKSTEAPRRRPEPLQDKPSLVERSESYNFESSESVKVIETTMLIDGKNQTVRFYYITQPVKLPLDVFQKMTGQANGNPSGVNVIKIRDKRSSIDVSSVSDHEDFDDL